MEKPDNIEREAFYRAAGKSFADYLGYPSFQEYMERTNWFTANLTKGVVEEKHFTGMFAEAAGESYDELVESMFPPSDGGQTGLRRFFEGRELLRAFEEGDSFVSVDGDAKAPNGTVRLLATCEMEKRDGDVFGLFFINDISGLYDPHSLARKYAEYDPLTRLFSRHAADTYGKEYLAMHPDEDAAMILIEVDHFKDFNDRYGHHIGDLVLKAIARELDASFGPDAIIGRNGGQEFLVFLKGMEPEAAEESIKRFSDAEHTIEHDGMTYSYGFSIGYCLYPSQGILYHDLARKADKAKYNVKLGGGNACCKFESEMMELNNF